MARGWTSDEVSGALSAHWRAQSAGEIQKHKEIARDKIEEAMQELYLVTGIEFEVRSKVVYTDEINHLTQWTKRSTYSISLLGYI